MHVYSLSLKNFRNYEALQTQFSPCKNLILGQNGQGKTNLLEALYFLSHAKSNRTTSDRELIRHGADFMSLSALVIYGHGGRHQLDVQMSLSPENRLKTLIKVDGSPLKSRSALLGYLPTVSFFLPDLLMVRGVPEDRRRWLDTAIVQYDRRHLHYLLQFSKIRLQKNQLLKQGTVDPAHLAVWNQQFAAAGAQVMLSRCQYLALIQDWAQIKYLELANSQEQLAFAYQSRLLDFLSRPPADLTLEEMEAGLLAALRQRQEEELRRGTCLVGPHRDDVAFLLNAQSAHAYGSQGQQRSIVLALKLTELQLLTQKLAEAPILLMDDVMAELDPVRQQLLLSHVSPESQVFLTTTHLDQTWKQLLPTFSDPHTAVFEVTQGTVKRQPRPVEASL